MVRLTPGASGGVEVHGIKRRTGADEEFTENAPHVLLPAPKAALKPLAEAFPAEIQADLDAVVGFRLLKAFLCMRRPSWWEKLPAPQTAAWTVPTRELHYFEDPSQHNAMMLLSPDEPAASYWAPSIEEPSAHDRAQIGGSLELKRELVRLLLRRQREAAANKQLESGLAAGDTLTRP